MDAIDVLDRDDRTGRSGGPLVDLVASRLRCPPTRPGTVRRSLLIERLALGDPRPIVSVVAPAGYGKTTLLSQWAERSAQSFAWVSVSEDSDDPKALLSYIAQALDKIEPIDQRVFDALASPASSVPGSVVPRLGAAFASMTAPVALILDDVHLLHDPESRAAVSMLADYVPPGSRLVLAARTQPALRFRLRAEGRILEIGPADLSLTRDEAWLLLRNADVALDEDDLAELHQRTEGWPAGLYLAALYLKEGGPLANAAASFGGDVRLVSEYLESEFLSRISGRRREFLTRTAVLERMSGPLCDAVLGEHESAATLAALAQSNLMLVPLDQRGEWYRYHHLFRDMLLAELERQEPELIPVLRRRASDWCLRDGLRQKALAYSMAAEDVDAAARLVEQLGIPTYRQGREATVRRWVRWLEERGGTVEHPMVAVLASIVSALTGQPAEAERWADAVDRWQYGDTGRPADPSTEAWAALMRAILCRSGVKQMVADANEAIQGFRSESLESPAPALVLGIARVLSGDLAGGDASLKDAVSIAEKSVAPDELAIALCERSLVAIARGEWPKAQVLASRAQTTLRQAGIEESYPTPLVCAVRARIAQHYGNTSAVRQMLVAAQRLRSVLTYALPHLAAQARIELIRVQLAIGDHVGAWTLIREIDELLERRPDLGNLADEARALRARLAEMPGPGAESASALTAAELRLLPMLSTHLSFPEIGEEMFLSRNTIKSEAVSIYRKLRVSSRSQAVARARALGLLDE